MKFPMYSIRDVHVGFMAPRLDTNDQTARRWFSFEINNREGVMSFEPKDFDLYKIAEFDQETGVILSLLPELICSGTSVYGEGMS